MTAPATVSAPALPAPASLPEPAAPASIVKPEPAAPALPEPRAGSTAPALFPYVLSFPRWKSSDAYWTRNNPDPREWTSKGKPVSAEEQGTSDRSLVVSHDDAGFVRISRAAVPVELGKGMDRSGAHLPAVPPLLTTPASLVSGGDSVLTIDALALGISPAHVGAFSAFLASLLFGAGIRTTTAEARKSARESEAQRTTAQSRKMLADNVRNSLAYVVKAGNGDTLALPVALALLTAPAVDAPAPASHGLALALQAGWKPEPRDTALLVKAESGKLPDSCKPALQSMRTAWDDALKPAPAAPAAPAVDAPSPEPVKPEPAPAAPAVV